MRSRAEQEARLQQINSWIADQNRWMDSARTPSSLTELQRSVDAAQVSRKRSRPPDLLPRV